MADFNDFNESDEIELNEQELIIYRQRLLDRQQELKALSESSREARSAVDLDQSRVGRLSRMDALQMQAMEQASENRRRIELQRIEKALALMDTGDYGECIHCGDIISAKRLNLDPSFINCVHCA